MLNNSRDLQSISYLLLAPGLAAWQWWYGFSWILYTIMVVVWIGIGVINHDHAHLPMWRRDSLNRLTELVGSVLQGHPVYVFGIAHNDDHHVHSHGPRDQARTYRFGGDHNHLLGHLLHPPQVLFVLYPFFFDYMKRVRHQDRAAFYRLCAQYTLLFASWGLLFWLDAYKALVLILIPQLVCLHWLLGANYLQHAHADGLSDWNFARNFTGAINWFYFNIGYHTAHHKQPQLHWSQLARQHKEIAGRIDSRLIEPCFICYVVRTFLFSVFMPSLRSRSLMSASEAH